MGILKKIYSGILDGLYFLGFPVFERSLFKKGNKREKYPIVIMPGFMATEKMFDRMQNYFESKGYKVYVPCFGMQLQDINKSALDLEIYVKKNKIGKFIFIGHSIGGLIGLLYWKKNKDKIERFVSISSPFKGTWIGYFGFMFKSPRQLVNKRFLEKLKFFRKDNVCSIATRYDEVVPIDSSKVNGVKFIEVDSIGHIGIAYDEMVYDKIGKLLKRKRL